MRRTPVRIAAALTVGVTLAACSSGNAEDGAAPENGDDALETAEPGSDLDLSEVCPETVVMQQDWQPEAEHAQMYQLVGPDYEIDADAKSVTGSLVHRGVDTGVDIEARPGGSNVGFQAVPALMYLDEDITLGAVNTNVAMATYADQPTVAVVAPLNVSPQILMWDPETYPEAETIEDVASTGATVLTAGPDILSVLEQQGLITPGQGDEGYDSSPSRFVSDPSILQQGFASAEPYIYEEEVSSWGRPVAYQLLADIGWNIYPEPYAVRADRLDELAPCLERLVPIIQQAQLDYFEDPTRTNQLIVELVQEYNTGWSYSEGVAEFAAEAMIEDGIVQDDPASGIFGAMDEERVSEIIETFTPVLETSGTPVPEGLQPTDLFTNEYLDPEISMGN